MLSFFKKNKEDDHLDVLDEIKEPFSMQKFIDEQIVERYNNFRKMLDEHGILFFLLSPFQYRNRLLIKIGIIILGVMIGLVPRSIRLVDETKERNASNELAQIADSNFRSGLINIRPLKSSQYDRNHVLVFNISGEITNGVPSTADRYQVDLRPERGVSYAEDVTYAYDIIPVSDNSRLLVVYVDNREQNDETGIYSLHVRVKGDEIKYPTSMEIVLSNNQETNTLFDQDGVDLAPLTNMIASGESDTIEKHEDGLGAALQAYELNEEALLNKGLGDVRLGMTYEDMLAYVESERVLQHIKDDSTVRDIERGSDYYEYIDDTGRDKTLRLYASLDFSGATYELSDEDIPQTAKEELERLQTLTDAITTELSSLNRAKISKFNRLVDSQSVLNREVDVNNLAVKGLSIVGDDGEHVTAPSDATTPKKHPNLSNEKLSDEDFINQQ